MSDTPRWTLGFEQRPDDIWQYSQFSRVLPGPVPLRIVQAGPEVEFCPLPMNGLAASSRFAEIVDRLAPGSIQRLPVTINSIQRTDYELIVLLDLVDCIDFEGSRLKMRSNPLPEQLAIGAIYDLVLKAPALEGHHFFSIKGWPVVRMCSERVIRGLADAGVSGLKATQVAVR